MEEIGGWEVKFDVLEKDVDLMLKSREKVEYYLLDLAKCLKKNLISNKASSKQAGNQVSRSECWSLNK